MYVPTEHFDIVVNDFDGKTSARASRIRYEQDQVHFIDDKQLQKYGGRSTVPTFARLLLTIFLLPSADEVVGK